MGQNHNNTVHGVGTYTGTNLISLVFHYSCYDGLLHNGIAVQRTDHNFWLCHGSIMHQ